METFVDINVQLYRDGKPYEQAVSVASEESVDFGLLEFFLSRHCDRQHLALEVRRRSTATRSEATITVGYVADQCPADFDRQQLIGDIQKMLAGSRPAEPPLTELMQQSAA